jgi:hypothetical protein
MNPQELSDHPESIPWTELVVVFDADMQAKKNFLLKVGDEKFGVKTVSVVRGAPLVRNATTFFHQPHP